ncbi:MAG: group I intron-associated PD-(D/E)XK endonuclease [Candidatus Saccharibacteria bacterium]
MLSKQKGDIAIGHAIAYFMAHGYEVCLPIGDKRDYDMVVEKDGNLARVQVKYAGWYGDRRRHQAALRVMGGNQSFHTAKKYGDDAFEYLFVHTANGSSYLIPWKSLAIRSYLSIDAEKYIPYKISMQG